MEVHRVDPWGGHPGRDKASNQICCSSWQADEGDKHVDKRFLCCAARTVGIGGVQGAQTFMPQSVTDASATSACTDAVSSAQTPFTCISELVCWHFGQHALQTAQFKLVSQLTFCTCAALQGIMQLLL